jgi:phosphoesterase RecJ-like protein
MKVNQNDINELFNFIETSKNICIAGHKAPDGDCIGSVMALYEFLKPLNKNLTVCIEGTIPFNFKPFVDENTLMKEYDGSKFDLVVTLDCSDAERLGKFKDILNNTKKAICIDHHITNLGFCDLNIISPDISSTGELLYNILKSAGKNINNKTAELLYIAILTDTGKFSYSNTNGNTHRVAAELVELGVNISEIDNLVYNSKPANVVKAFTDCIAGIELYFENKFGIAFITQAILNDNNVDMNDVDGVVEFIREIKEVEVSCLLKEYSENNTKVSLRSKNNIDVSKISQKYGGGGHKRAAGFEIETSIHNAKNLIIDYFKEYFGE